MHPGINSLLFGMSMLLMSPCTVQAAQSGKTNLKIHGTIEVIECVINDGESKEINFGDAVGIHRVDGIRYKKPVPFSVQCTNTEGGEIPDLTLTIEGEKTSFDAAAVRTNVDDFGIQLQNNDTPVELNKEITFKLSSVPVLSAVPVRNSKAELEAKDFYATVKLVVGVA